jgi:hypothetical protein
MTIDAMTRSGEPWHRLPIVWLGATILFACIVGCVSMIILAARHPDEPLPVDSDPLLKMPAAQPAEPAR